MYYAINESITGPWSIHWLSKVKHRDYKRDLSPLYSMLFKTDTRLKNNKN